MVDSEYSMSIYISLKISIGILRINPEMLKLIPDHLKIKTMVSMQLKNYLIYYDMIVIKRNLNKCVIKLF